LNLVWVALTLIDGNFAAYFDVQTKYSVQDGFFEKNEEAVSSLACHYVESSSGDVRLFPFYWLSETTFCPSILNMQVIIFR